MAPSFDDHLAQVDAALAALEADRAILVGVSYGGLVALRYAARHPSRVQAIVAASCPGPRHVPSARYARWIASPRRSLPLFLLTAPIRSGPEIRAAIPGWRDRLRFSVRQGWCALRAPMSGVRASARVRFALSQDFGPDAQRITCGALLVTGEDHLDRVVPAASTREYVDLIPGARYVRLTGTGHMGTVTRAAAFAATVREFIGMQEGPAAATRPVVRLTGAPADSVRRLEGA